LKYLPFGFAVYAFIAGLVAAGYWSASIKASIDPSREKRSDGERVYIMSWVESVMKTSAMVASLNKKAAFWTAVSVLAGGASVLLGTWPSN
jgi:hypothetical protein